MRISLIVAMDRGRLIGRDNDLPWRLPDDLAHFKRLTRGKPVVMGRKTYASIGRPLPERTNIVVSRSPGFAPAGVTVVGDLDAALAAAAATGAEEVMIMGGETLYRALLPRADRLYLTEVQGRFEGDAWFPAIPASEWRETEREHHPADARHAQAFDFVTLERVG